MDDNRLKFGVGVLVIAAIGIGVILTFLFGAVPRVLTGEFKLFVTFPAAEGISTNTPVLLRGVEIGRVIDKELRETDVLLELGIDSEYQNILTHEYLPRIGTGSVITGDAKLEFYKAPPERLASVHADRWPRIRNEIYTDDELLNYGETSNDPFSVLVNLEDEVRITLDSIRTASDALQNVGDNVNQLVTQAQGVVGTADDELDDVAQEARQALIEFQGAMRDIRDVIGDEELKESLGQALAGLPDVLNEAQTTLQSTQKTFESFERVGQQFEEVGVAAEKTVQNVDRTVDTVRETVQSAERGFASAERAVNNIEKITEPIAENSEVLVDQVLTSLANLDRTLRQVETFGAKLNNSDGTVRRLLEDDEIYWQVRRTIENVEMATAKLRPILDDVRIFSDKIARDPRSLGVRGALDRRPSGLGLK
jgi:phospholipid/cholesterol/gamma-HCH transport system substrate-binding protein